MEVKMILSDKQIAVLTMMDKTHEHEIVDTLQSTVDARIKGMLAGAKKSCSDKAGTTYDQSIKNKKVSESFKQAGITRQSYIADAVFELESIKL